MATWATTAVIVYMDICHSPEGILTKKHVVVKAISLWKLKQSTLLYYHTLVLDPSNMSTCYTIGFRRFSCYCSTQNAQGSCNRGPATSRDYNNVGITWPDTAPHVPPTENQVWALWVEQDSRADGDDEEDEEDDELETGPAVDGGKLDRYEITSENTKCTHDSLVEGLETRSGRTPLRFDVLNDPPNINGIVNRFCCVIGNIFHAIDRQTVPIKYEARKWYCVALRKAFLAWNQVRMKELER